MHEELDKESTRIRLINGVTCARAYLIFARKHLSDPDCEKFLKLGDAVLAGIARSLLEQQD